MTALHLGDCLEVMAGMEPDSVDAVATDPPYGLTFMGKNWDYGVPGVHFWQEAFRLLKPAHYLVAFGGTRTHHRLMCALEDAGFEIRDTLMWLYGSGFPKGKGQLKPAWEPIVLCRKPGGKVRALGIDECRVGFANEDDAAAAAAAAAAGRRYLADQNEGRTSYGEFTAGNAAASVGPYLDNLHKGRWPANLILDEELEPVHCLRYTIPEDIKRVIGEFYRDYQLPAVRQGNGQAAQPRRAKQVLLTGLLGEVAEREQTRHESPDVREAPPAGIHSEDEGQPAGGGEDGATECQLEGRPLPGPSRLLACAAGEQIHPGAPAGDGANAGTATAGFGEGTPSERQEERQPTGELDGNGQRRSQENASGDACHSTRVEATELRPAGAALRVLLCDIPRGWLGYFEDTGLVVRTGAGALLDEQSGERASGGSASNGKRKTGLYEDGLSSRIIKPRFDSGGASRFFYCPKASRAERNAGCEGLEEGPPPASARSNPAEGRSAALGQPRPNHHPTVKPVGLMRWLVRLMSPENGTVLDPFMGSGTTGVACVMERRDFIGIEKEPDYLEVARARIDAVTRQQVLL